jgi:hypothetical protein
MPPRYAYWTILIDGKATAFRARDREELLPTFNQLARKNADIVMRYFARGRLWDNPEQAQWASRNQLAAARTEKRDRDWRPGGQHKDPRARFERKKTERRRPPPERTALEKPPARPNWPGKPEQRSADSKERRAPRFDARTGKRPVRRSGPPRRKPR